MTHTTDTELDELGISERRLALRLILFPSPMPIPEPGDVKVVLDKLESLIAKEVAEKELVARIDEAGACKNLILNTGPYASKLITDRITQLTAQTQPVRGGEDE